MIRALASIAEDSDQPAAARVRAMALVLDHAVGRPGMQEPQVSVSVEAAIEALRDWRAAG